MDMEAREAKSNKKNRLMRYLSRALTFQNHPHFSPGREPKPPAPPRLSDAYKNRAPAAQNRGFSGPLMSLVPIEARGHNKKKGMGKKKDKEGGGGGFDSDADEPRSPKVSCIGQIKQKQRKLNELTRDTSKKKLEGKLVHKATKKIPNSSGGMFRQRSKSGAAAPGLSEMKRYSSGRDAFANFDWTKQQVAPLDRECYSDDEHEQRRRDYWDDDDEEEEDKGDVMIPFSAPMMMGGDVIQLEPRKEISLWKKRNMPPPKPLNLNTFIR